jgi:glutaminyl-peptide cyclotransferase
VRKLTPFLFVCIAALTIAFGCSAGKHRHTGDAAVNSTQKVPAFDQDRAFTLLKKQVELGPRCPGTQGHKFGLEFIVAQLKPYADAIRTQDFTVTINGKQLKLRNIIAHFNLDADRWILLAAHWDTRPTADLEIDAAKRKQPIPGANDGASGTAVLLELARMFASKRPRVGVLMVFFDGEDYGTTEAEMLLGSKHFARNLPESAAINGKPIKIDYGILLDMIGDRKLNIYKERNSVESAREIVDKIWTTAERLGHREFHPFVKYAILDDHVPLIRSGIKCVGIIDFDYASWHTLDDTPDKCSPRSLAIVGEVVATVVYSER